jgi:hypothetical protein
MFSASNPYNVFFFKSEIESYILEQCVVKNLIRLGILLIIFNYLQL